MASMTDAVHQDDEPRCDKCGAPITTGLMAAFCPNGKGCEFYVPELDEFLAYFKEPTA